MKRKYRTLQSFQSGLESDAKLMAEFQSNPMETLQKHKAGNPLSWDTWVYRIVVSSLGGVLLIITLGVTILLFTNNCHPEKEIPSILTALGSGALGALAGILTAPKITPEDN